MSLNKMGLHSLLDFFSKGNGYPFQESSLSRIISDVSGVRGLAEPLLLLA